MELRFYGSKRVSLYTGILSCIMGGFAFGFGLSGLTPLQLFTEFLRQWNLETEYTHLLGAADLYWSLIAMGIVLLSIGLLSMRHATTKKVVQPATIHH